MGARARQWGGRLQRECRSSAGRRIHSANDSLPDSPPRRGTDAGARFCGTRGLGGRGDRRFYAGTTMLRRESLVVSAIRGGLLR